MANILKFTEILTSKVSKVIVFDAGGYYDKKYIRLLNSFDEREFTILTDSFIKKNLHKFYKSLKNYKDLTFGLSKPVKLVNILHQRGILFKAYTTKIDGELLRNNIPEEKVVEINGNIFRRKCDDCHDVSYGFNEQCEVCHGDMIPNLTFSSVDYFDRMIEDINECDCFVMIDQAKRGSNFKNYCFFAPHHVYRLILSDSTTPLYDRRYDHNKIDETTGRDIFIFGKTNNTLNSIISCL